MKDPFPLSDDEAYDFLSKALKTMITREDLPIGPGERGRLYAWYWGYYGRAAVDLLLHTGEKRFATLVEDTVESLLALRDDELGLLDDARDRVVPSWGTKYKSGDRANEITTAGLIALPMIEYAKATGTTWIRDAAIEALVAFKGERRATEDGEYYYWHMTDNSVEALNHSALYGAALAHSSQVTSDPWFRETALGIQRYHDRFIVKESGRSAWPYAPNPSNSAGELPPEAIWKAAATIELPIALDECQLLSDPGTLDGIARTVHENRLMREKKLPQFIGTSRLVEATPQKVSTSLTSFIGSFLQIDSDPLRQVIIGLMEERSDLFPNGWKGGSRAMIMAWAHLRVRGVL